MADTALVILEKSGYLLFEPLDPHLFATAFGAAASGVRVSVLLRGGAVNYAVKGQDVSDVRIAGIKVPDAETPGDPASLLEFITKNQGEVYVIREDLERRGWSEADLGPGIRVISMEESVDVIESKEALLVW